MDKFHLQYSDSDLFLLKRLSCQFEEDSSATKMSNENSAKQKQITACCVWRFSQDFCQTQGKTISGFTKQEKILWVSLHATDCYRGENAISSDSQLWLWSGMMGECRWQMGWLGGVYWSPPGGRSRIVRGRRSLPPPPSQSHRSDAQYLVLPSTGTSKTLQLGLNGRHLVMASWWETISMLDSFAGLQFFCTCFVQCVCWEKWEKLFASVP